MHGLLEIFLSPVHQAESWLMQLRHDLIGVLGPSLLNLSLDLKELLLMLTVEPITDTKVRIDLLITVHGIRDVLVDKP